MSRASASTHTRAFLLLGARADVLRRWLFVSASVAGLACTEPSQTVVVISPPEPAPSEFARSPAPLEPPPQCLTIRDAELGCSRRCDDLLAALRSCAQPEANGRILVTWRWNTRETDVTLEVQGAGMSEAAECVRARMTRFVPCDDTKPQQGTFPVLVRPRAGVTGSHAVRARAHLSPRPSPTEAPRPQPFQI